LIQNKIAGAVASAIVRSEWLGTASILAAPGSA
jgi:hypothetical protein